MLISQGLGKPQLPAPTSVLLDANVLYKYRIRTVFLYLVESGLVRVFWTTTILDEWLESFQEKKPGMVHVVREEQSIIRETYPEAMVEGFEPRMTDLDLPDPGDHHVLAAAIHCGPRYFVTDNLNDFPENSLEPHYIVAIGSDDFLSMIHDRYPELVRKVLLEFQQEQKRLGHHVPDLANFLA